MINKLRSHLGIKLFLSYLGVLLVAVIVLGSTTQFSVPRAFNRHMLGMGHLLDGSLAPGGMGPGMMGGAGLGQGNGPPRNVSDQFYLSFRNSFNDALAYAGLAAVISAIGVSFYFSRRIISPLRAMMAASQRLADGHYDERVKVERYDELGELAMHFNQMAIQLEVVEARRKQLIGDVAHELRTPLTAIKGSMEGLMDGVLDSDASTFEQIYKEADRLGRLVDDLQELSKVESGAFELDIRPLSVRDLIETTSRRLSRQFDEKGVSLSYQLEDELPYVLADELRIGQVLINLVGNALQYTNTGGKVSIHGKKQGNAVHLSVVDTGIGIAPEHLDQVFMRFFRADKSRSRRAGGGSGIGLTIAKHLVEAHGGKIWVTSEGELKGSHFTFTLPAASEKI